MMISPDLQEVRSAGMFVRESAEKLLSEVDAGQMELCVVEVLTNIVKHGYEDSKGQTVEIQVEVTVDDAELTVSVRDNGPGIPEENLKAQLEFDPLDIDSLPEGGMGLFIVSEFVDSMNYESNEGRNVFVMAKSAAS